MVNIFSTRFECSFTSSPLVSSVVLHLLHSFRVCFSCVSGLSAEALKRSQSLDDLVRSIANKSSSAIETLKAVGENYTRNEWKRCESTLERVRKMSKYTRNEWRRCENYTRNEWKRCENYTRNELKRCESTLERVRKMSKYTRNEWRRCENTLETSEEDVKTHSKRVENFRSADQWFWQLRPCSSW